MAGADQMTKVLPQSSPSSGLVDEARQTARCGIGVPAQTPAAMQLSVILGLLMDEDEIEAGAMRGIEAMGAETGRRREGCSQCRRPAERVCRA